LGVDIALPVYITMLGLPQPLKVGQNRDELLRPPLQFITGGAA